MILIFAGAGASTALNPAKYPTTEQYFQRLPDGIARDPLFSLVTDYFESVGESTPDIEQVLWELADLSRALQQLASTRQLLGYAFDQNRLGAAARTSGDTHTAHSKAPQWARQTESLRQRIHEHVYDLYGEEPTSEEIGSTWGPLIDKLLSLHANVQVFTTNYDTVLEDSLEAVAEANPNHPRVETGAAGPHHRPRLSLRHWTNASLSQPGGLLTKLHGSVDWSWDQQLISTGNRIYKGDHKKHVIVYPGYKGEAEDTPFREFHRHFERSLENAKAMLFVGYAFRDPYLNQAIQRYRNKDSPCLVVNPQEDLSVPFEEGSYFHHAKGFAGEVIHHPFFTSLVNAIHS
ncbi:hypothetical protein ABI59_09450 [Acidobacteria bacterium Mor1]|nr:hypothetical protein ABI59_09450 [Acidobacteria bacterium Mor1]